MCGYHERAEPIRGLPTPRLQTTQARLRLVSARTIHGMNCGPIFKAISSLDSGESVWHCFVPARFCAKDFMQPDLSLWGIYTWPLGLAICFGPVLIAWAIDVAKTGGDEKKNDKR